MKKVIIACFFSILMLMVPITTASQTANISSTKNTNTENLSNPEFYLLPEQYVALVTHVETNYVGADKDQAYSILNDIIGSNLRVDAIELADAWEEYSYHPIPQEELDEIEPGDLTALQALILAHWALNAFGGLIQFITGLIKDRLGWLHYVINKGYDLCVDGVFLAINIVTDSYDLLLAIVDAVNLMLTVPQVFSEMIGYLFNQQFNEFLNVLGEFTQDFLIVFGQFLRDLLDWIDNIPAVINYLGELVNFVAYFLFKPWKNNVRISGTVRINFIPAKDATVTCKDKSVTTDSSGGFYFDFTPSEAWGDSFPANSFFGFHNFQITVEKDGKVLKQTPAILSYACSDGAINWPILIIKGRSRTAGFNTFLMEKLSNFFEMIQNFMPNIYRLISRIDSSSV